MKPVIVLRMVIAGLLLVLAGAGLTAQDVHFSQFDLLPSAYNPARLPGGAGEWWATAVYRDQWRSVPVPYQSTGLLYDRRLAGAWLPLDGWSWGGAFLYDRAGDGRLSWSRVEGHLANRQPLGDELTAGAGLGLRFGQRTVQPDRLAFGDQYDGEQYDPANPTAEDLLRTGSTFFSWRAGLSLDWQDPDSRTHAGWGIAGDHLNRPVISFLDGNGLPLSPVWQTSLTTALQLTGQLDLAGRLLARRQGAYREYMLGTGLLLHRPLDDIRTLTLGLHTTYRWQDAFIFALEGRLENWTLGLSWDWTTSALRTANRGRGGAEIVVRYTFLPVPPVEEFKSCPIF